MSKCPKCGEEIDGLTNYSDSRYSVTYDPEEDRLEYEFEDHTSDEGAFLCPECDEILFEGHGAEKEAKAFLKGEVAFFNSPQTPEDFL